MSAYNHRRRLLSTGSLYVDIDKEEREAFNELNRDENLDELEWSLKPLRDEFKSKGNDILFKNYTSRLQHRMFTILLMFNMVVNFIDSFWYFFYKTDFSFPFPAMLRLTALIVYISFLILAHHNEKWFRPSFARTIAAIAVLMAMIYAEYGGFIFTVTGDKNSFKWKRLRPVYYLIICNELLLPFPSRVYSVIATLFIISIEITVTLVWPHVSDTNCQSLTPGTTMATNSTFVDYYDRYKYLTSDVFFYVCAACIAYFVTFLLEIVNRRAFLDHRRCVESKFKLNFEKDQQERLLGSCLPQHLMKRVKKDIKDRFTEHMASRENKSSISRPFTELYIEKFNDVTILYADIVNSMLLTQSMETPQELVETLNELFTRFDSRAEANNCLRIKLLGDCYYCVCGIPEYDENHALNSINMDNQVNVDMRIGVHTGMVYSGLLGLKKWQYDIWSIDSMKAANMEHDGKPGYVHVTKTTLDLVPKQMKSEFHIQEYNVLPYETTYLIRKSRPHISGAKYYVKQLSRTERTFEKTRYNNNSRNSSLSSRSSSRIGSLSIGSQRRATVLDGSYHVGLEKFREMLSFASDTISHAIDKMPLNLKRQYNCSHHSLEINPHLLHFIPKRNSESPTTKPNQLKTNLKHIHTLDLKLERLYFQENDPIVAIMTIRFLTLYDEHANWGTFWYTNGSIVFYFTVIFIAFSLYITHKKNYEIKYLYRILMWFLITFSLILISCLDVIQCPVSDKFTQEKTIEDLDRNNGGSHECLYKWSRYYTYSTVLALTSVSMFIRINLWLKFGLGTISLIIINSLTEFHSCSVFLKIDAFYHDQNFKELEFFTPRLAHMQYLFVVYLMFYVIDRQIEYILRLDFLWSIKLKRERQEARVTRNINQLLLKNMLPIHVAERYLLTGPDPIDDDLYYEAYNSIAVMFASIPNFFKFYNRLSFTNDEGIKFLEILNSIICEFDRLLLLPAYNEKIEKIKTIGSTYMAAAGLKPGRASIRSIDSVISTEEEIENLLVLIRFAMAMAKTLRRFNSHNESGNELNFKLRIGVAMGPVTAGVVGSVKPQYDIWGDTVNVASRMDTNGLTEQIHTTEVVANLLNALNYDIKPVCRGPIDIKGKGIIDTYLIDTQQEMIDEYYGLP
ncbi:unnamed protein product [Oppiella nova]|uniref:adenylate cyclase n=1 Tax=Oppiella nova TaxID=334625 RepID=A0A7R9LNJ5_9ACAR|nr:unnamed protein product [Oppiella nova]CAG2165322.1 unnamed protein product [Oppiella nova]